MAWRVMTEKKHSTRLSQEQAGRCEVQSDALVLRPGQPRADLGGARCGVVVAHHPQLAAGAGGGHLLQEPQELAVAVPRVAGIGDRAGGYLQGGEQCSGAMAT